jgi:hypothetical protein
MRAKYTARATNTVDRVAEIIGDKANREVIRSAVTRYLETFERVQKYTETGRVVTYFELELLPFETHLDETRTVKEKEKVRRLAEALAVLGKAVRDPDLPSRFVELRDSLDRLDLLGWAAVAHNEATRKLPRDSVPKQPEQYYAAVVAANVLRRHGPLRYPSSPNSKFVWVATALCFNGPVQDHNREQMWWACKVYWSLDRRKNRPK